MKYGKYKIGSTIIPFLKNTHDIDTLYLFENEDDLNEYLRTYNYNKNEDAYFNTIQTKNASLSHKFYCWCSYYIQLIEGEDIWSPPTRYYLLDHIEEYKNKVKDFINKWDVGYSNYQQYTAKVLYQILIGLYIIKNNSSDLNLFTEEQKNNIQLAHDHRLPYEVFKTDIKDYVENEN